MQAEQQQKQQAEQAQQLQMKELSAKADEAEAKARKAIAEADRAEAEAKLMKQQLASGHMDELRKIEAHSHTMARGQVQHAQSTQHAQDKHEVGMTMQGMDAAGKLNALVQGGEKHAATIKNMNAPKPSDGGSRGLNGNALCNGIFRCRPTNADCRHT